MNSKQAHREVGSAKLGMTSKGSKVRTRKNRVEKGTEDKRVSGRSAEPNDPSPEARM